MRIEIKNNKTEFMKIMLFLFLALVGSIIVSGAVSAASLGNTPQPKYHHDNNNTGQSQYTGPQTNATKWKYKTGNMIYSSPSIGTDGTIYIGSTDYNLYALNPNGTTKWKYTTGGVISSSPAIGSDGTIYFGSCDDNVYALNTNGTLKWKYTAGNKIYSSPSIGSDGTIYIGCIDNNLYAIQPNGTLKWTYNIGGMIHSSPAIGSDGTIYIGSEDNNLYAINNNGTLKWKYTAGNRIYSSPSIGSDGTIYIGCFDDNLYAINPNGTLKWKYKTGDEIIVSSPAIGTDGTIYIGSADENLYAINPNGTLKWKYKTEDIINSSPTIGKDGTIYIGGTDYNLYSINPNGTTKWTYTTAGGISDSSPAIGSDGTIYIGSDCNLYAINDVNVTASIVSGNYMGSRQVSLSSNYPGTIYYKIDDPKNIGTWKKYSSPILIQSSCNLKFYEVETNGNISPTVTETYTITYLPPKVSPSLGSGHYTSSQKVTLTTTSKLATKTYYTTDGTDPQSSRTKQIYTSPLTIKNTTTLRFSALDSKGSWSSKYTVTYIITTPVVPKVISSNPKNKASKVSRTNALTVKFNENIYKNINIGKIYLKNMSSGKLVKLNTTIKGNTLTLKHTTLNRNTTYQLYIPKGSVKDKAGHKLNTNYSIKFKTVK
ncbi:MAG: PQQ-binding-like beta-propeller repeat protein [Methanobacterium sp. ERen5]|nr:MAG: PQQ-binding-like beta-propeller repeat protein [Methanobacterium sp. ERen5]